MKIRHIPSIHQRRKKRVVAYCRVSTDMKSQEESFETQVSYYQSYIERNDEWVLAGIYADGGVSATGAAKRPEFMRMIADAMEGKIDLILVKSISRFSRNVVDCQVYVQQLRSKGVEVRFEKERLSSLDASSRDDLLHDGRHRSGREPVHLAEHPLGLRETIRSGNSPYGKPARAGL